MTDREFVEVQSAWNLAHHQSAMEMNFEAEEVEELTRHGPARVTLQGVGLWQHQN